MAKKFRKAWLMHTLPPSLLARHSSDHDSRGRRDNGGEREREVGVAIEAEAEIMRNILSIEATDTTQTSFEPNMGTPTKGADDQSFHQR